MRLDEDQRKLLLDSATPEGAHAIRFYRPIMRLLQVGLVEPLDGGAPNMNTTRWRATAAGRDLMLSRGWIESLDATAPRAKRARTKRTTRRTTRRTESC